MTTPLLLTLGLIPSMFLLFGMLATFSDSTRAYAAISLIPLALGLTVIALRSLYRPRPVVLLVVATLLTASLVGLRVTRWM